jgi:hypothetical protein
VQLFADRARLSQATFVVTQANAPAVAQVCQRLDGIPLAIELAAARVRALPVEQINTRLNDMFRLLTGGSRTALPRQQTLRALIDWSYDLLSEAERTLLRRLSVFAGGWTLDAAEAVCHGENVEAWEALDLLTSLVDKSLVVYEAREEEDRYRLLETVRQYARDRLLESREGAAVRLRHLEFFLQFGEEAERELSVSPSLEWLQWCESERDNLRAALKWSLAQPNVRPPMTDHCPPEMGLRLAGALWKFWGRGGYVGEGREWLERALQQGKSAPAALQAKALLGAYRLAYMDEEWAPARALAEQSVGLFREADDDTGLAQALVCRACLARRRGEPAVAIPLLAESLALWRRLGNREEVYESLSHLAWHARAQGDQAAAETYEQERVAVVQELGGVRAAVFHFARRAEEAIRLEDQRELRALCDEGCRLRRRWGTHEEIANELIGLAEFMFNQRDYALARSLFEE